ncbi:conserved hypothetical protein [Microsporum canis CBS 113480]|uniref:Uncharacterized protein n=1 Tax=Arthroderma otae (strain ATCC MYA-4605 / CBS 113480) TaxID=554155 RepID=C5FWS4_ARTOC|nr:conserved hypothetical protein [Microsporum canis CBS 113480]EEQ33332.1 conserved hypothetical protein [Microsporum canis CBS 113480]
MNLAVARRSSKIENCPLCELQLGFRQGGALNCRRIGTWRLHKRLERLRVPDRDKYRASLQTSLLFFRFQKLFTKIDSTVITTKQCLRRWIELYSQRYSLSFRTINARVLTDERTYSLVTIYPGFVGLVTAAAVWSIWGSEMFPAEADPTGDPEYWTFDELRRWLRVRGRLPNEQASREELLERVKANMRP